MMRVCSGQKRSLPALSTRGMLTSDAENDGLQDASHKYVGVRTKPRGEYSGGSKRRNEKRGAQTNRQGGRKGGTYRGQGGRQGGKDLREGEKEEWEHDAHHQKLAYAKHYRYISVPYHLSLFLSSHLSKWWKQNLRHQKGHLILRSNTSQVKILHIHFQGNFHPSIPYMLLSYLQMWLKQTFTVKRTGVQNHSCGKNR